MVGKIQYRPEKLNPADTPSRRPDYEQEDLFLIVENVDPTLITQKFTSEVASLQKLNQHLACTNQYNLSLKVLGTLCYRG